MLPPKVLLDVGDLKWRRRLVRWLREYIIWSCIHDLDSLNDQNVIKYVLKTNDVT